MSPEANDPLKITSPGIINPLSSTNPLTVGSSVSVDPFRVNNSAYSPVVATGASFIDQSDKRAIEAKITALSFQVSGLTTALEVTKGTNEKLREEMRVAMRENQKAGKKVQEDTKKAIEENRLANEGLRKEMRDALEKNKEAGDKIKQDSFQTLALFVGLFTFVSVEFQLFRTSEAAYIVPLSFVFTGALLGFISITLIAMKKSATWMLTVLSLSFGMLVVGTTLYYHARGEGMPALCGRIKTQLVEQSTTLPNERLDNTQTSQLYKMLECK